MTLDDTRKNIVVIASIALAIIGVTLTYNVHGGTRSGDEHVGRWRSLVCTGSARRCNEARASGAESKG